MKAHDLIGKRFGKLTVESRYKNTSGGKCRWICVCDCGIQKAKPVTSSDLLSGKVKSCGCLYKQSNKNRNKTHGLRQSRIYRIWSGMLQRCRTNNNYVDRCISVDYRWLNFQPFYEWAIANGYRDDLSIDRIDNDKGYSPENCRWVDMKTQQNNRRNNRIIKYYGIDFTISELAQKLNISPATLLWRVNNGWGQAEWGIKPNYNNKIRRKSL